MSLLLISSAFAISKGQAFDICEKATQDCVMLPQGAYGFTNIVYDRTAVEPIYQVKLLQNNDDFQAYVNMNIDRYAIVISENDNGKSVVYVGEELEDKEAIYDQRTSEAYLSLAKDLKAEAKTTVKDNWFPVIEPTIEKEEPRAPIRTLEIVGNNAGNWGFGCQPGSNSYNFCGIGSGKTITSWSQNHLSRLW